MRCKKQSNRQAPSATVTDPYQGWSILAQISMAHDAQIYTSFQGMELMDYTQRFDGQDHQLTNQQHPGGRTYLTKQAVVKKPITYE